MDSLLELSARNLRRAREIIADAGVYGAWESIGAEVNLVGSVKTGLLMKHRDVDFHIYSKPLVLAESFSAMATLAAHPSVKRIECVNMMETEERCVEWHAWYLDADGETWQLDMIHIERGSLYDGYMEKVAARIGEALTPERKLAILRLKFDTPDAEKIPGIEYCQAVIRDGVETYDEFVEWRKAHSSAGVVQWMP